MQNSAKLCVKNDVCSGGRAGQKVNADFCGNFQVVNSCFFSEQLSKHLDIETESICLVCERCGVICCWLLNQPGF